MSNNSSGTIRGIYHIPINAKTNLAQDMYGYTQIFVGLGLLGVEIFKPTQLSTLGLIIAKRRVSSHWASRGYLAL